MDGAELAFAGISRQAELLRAREISSAELVDLYLERIERINPDLNAFTEVFAERAREEAAAADQRLGSGGDQEEAPLLGVPVALKDELDVEGLVAQHGTDAYSEPARADSAHWARLSSAGAVLLAKTTLPELAICGFTETEVWGETRNPWDLSRTTGGSSGGSGAAVAAGLVGAASASDGAGSIRIPAANCGLFGLKPQRGRISLAPLAEHWLGMTSSGCLARRVADAALWLDVAAGPMPGDRHTPPEPEAGFREAAAFDPGRLRIAWTATAPPALAPPHRDEEMLAALERTGAALSRLGHAVEERAPDWGLVGNDVAVMYLKGIESEFDEVPHPERLERRTRGFKRLARTIPESVLRGARRREAAHADRIGAVFGGFDLLMTPTTAIPAVEVGGWSGRGALRTLVGMSRVYPYTAVWNYLGLPAASVPAGISAGGLPLGVQLVAPAGREDLLLAVGAQLEAELGWAELRPPLALDG